MVPPFMKINKKPNQSTFAAICTINRPQNVCCNLNKQLATKHLLQFAHPATKRLLQFVHPATKRLLQFVHLPHRLSHTGLATQAFSHHIGFMCCHTGFSHHTGFIFCHTGFFLPHRFYLLPHRLSSPHRFYLSPHRLFSPHRFIFCHTGSFFTKANMLQDLLLSATQALFKIYLIALVQKPKPKVKIIFRSHSAHIHPLYGCFFLELILLFSLKHVLYFL